MEKDDDVILIIKGVKYNVTKYIFKHPGEGISNVYLEDYHNRDVTNEFKYYHADNLSKAKGMLKTVREKGKCSGITVINS